MVIVHSSAGGAADGPTLPNQEDAESVVRVDLRALQNGELGKNTPFATATPSSCPAPRAFTCSVKSRIPARIRFPSAAPPFCKRFRSPAAWSIGDRRRGFGSSASSTERSPRFA